MQKNFKYNHSRSNPTASVAGVFALGFQMAAERVGLHNP